MPVDLITEKGLPHSLDAERSVLGALILDNEALYRIRDFIRSDDFYSGTHRILYERIGEILDRQRAVDLLILKEELGRSGELDQVGGISYIASLIDSLPSSRNIENYAHIIKEKAVLRNLIRAGYDIIDSCYKQEQEPDEILTESENKIFAIGE